MESFHGLYNDLSKKKKQFTVAGNHECTETDSINSEKSSLKSHPDSWYLWFYKALATKNNMSQNHKNFTFKH